MNRVNLISIAVLAMALMIWIPLAIIFIRSSRKNCEDRKRMNDHERFVYDLRTVIPQTLGWECRSTFSVGEKYLESCNKTLVIVLFDQLGKIRAIYNSGYPWVVEFSDERSFADLQDCFGRKLEKPNLVKYFPIK